MPDEIEDSSFLACAELDVFSRSMLILQAIRIAATIPVIGTSATTTNETTVFSQRVLRPPARQTFKNPTLAF